MIISFRNDETSFAEKGKRGFCYLIECLSNAVGRFPHIHCTVSLIGFLLLWFGSGPAPSAA